MRRIEIGVGVAAGVRTGVARPGDVHERDRQSVLAARNRQPLALSRDQRLGRPAERRRRRHGQDQADPRHRRGRRARHRQGTGHVVEDTYDWYAQDADGNIWYLGEDTKEYKNGKVATTEGSWQAGVDGAQPGIAVPADPEPGLSYREEYYAGQAEDAARVLAVDEKVEVPYGFFQGALLAQNVTALAPKVAEHKFYVKGIGPVREISVSGGSDETELVHFTRGR